MTFQQSFGEPPRLTGFAIVVLAAILEEDAKESVSGHSEGEPSTAKWRVAAWWR